MTPLQPSADNPSRGVADEALPALPEDYGILRTEGRSGSSVSERGYTAEQMRDYARAALQAAALPAVPSVPDAILRAFSDAAVDAVWAGTGFIRLTATDGEITAECVPASSVTLATPAHDQPEGEG